MKEHINGQLFKDMVLYGAAAVTSKKQAINDLNVFPVPDGDTGTKVRAVNVYIDSMMIG